MSSARAALTVVHVGGPRVARVDLGAGADAAVVFSTMRTAPAGGVDAAVREALGAGGRPAARTIVLDESAWTQTLDLPDAALDGLSVAESSRALAYELEPVTSVPAAESVVATRSLGASTSPGASSSRQRLWVTQVRASARAAVQDALAAKGSALAGLAHPAGIAAPHGSATVPPPIVDLAGVASTVLPTTPPTTVEVWDRCTLCVTDHGATTTVIAAKAGGRSWEQRLLERLAPPMGADDSVRIEWRGRVRPTAALLAAHPRIDDRGPLAADGDDAIEWLRACAAALATPRPPVPMLGRAPRPARTLRPALVAVVVTVVAVGLMTADWMRIDGEAKRIERDALRADAMHDQVAAETKSRAELSKKTAELKRAADTKEAPVRRADAEWSAQRDRPLALLRTLVDKRPPSTLLVSIKPDPAGALEVRGVGAERNAIDAYVAELEPLLRGAHWRVGPAHASQRATEGGRRFVEFTFTAAPEPTSPPEPAKTRP